MMEWIRTTDRLPECPPDGHSAPILLNTASEDILIGAYWANDNIFMDESDTELQLCDVCYWMPIAEIEEEKHENRMSEIAKMLGVKMNERFVASGCEYHIDERGLKDKHGNLRMTILGMLICGKLAIEKLPWKPQKNDEYYVPQINSKVTRHYWTGDSIDLALYCTGGCFKTVEEAEEHTSEFIEKLQKKYKGDSK